MITFEDIMPIDILIVDDNRADIRLVQEILKKGKMIVNLHSVLDGMEAMEYLRKEGKYKDANYPDLILLDLNMPRKDGREVLEEIKSDDRLQTIPVIVMTISKAEEDILKSYKLHANAYIVKPIELNQFMNVVSSIEDFWLTIVKLPPNINKVETILNNKIETILNNKIETILINKVETILNNKVETIPKNDAETIPNNNVDI